MYGDETVHQSKHKWQLYHLSWTLKHTFWEYGCISGITTRFITQPLDVIKIRTQLLKEPKRSAVVYRVARRIFWEEGFTAFWHGHCLGQVHSILAVSSQFYVYEITTRFAANFSFNQYLPIAHFFCGCIAGCTSTTLVIPLEVIRVRQIIVNDQYRGFIHGAKAVYRYGGPFAFYEGLGASLMQMGPQVGIAFTVFGTFQPYILSLLGKCPPGECHKNIGNKHKPQHLLIASSIAGSIAGFVAKTITYPFDMAKRRLQIGSHKSSSKYKVPSQSRSLLKCRKLIACLVCAYKKEGIKGLFRGWTVTIYKAQMTSIFAFTTYELVCYAIREMDANL